VQGNAHDLGHCIRVEMIKLVARKYPKALCCKLSLVFSNFSRKIKIAHLPRACAARTTGSLLGRGLADPELLQLHHVDLLVDAHLLDLARVDDEANAVNRDRRFGNVGREDALAHAVGGNVKHLVLLLDRKRAVQHEDDPLFRVGRVGPKLLGQVRDLVYAREEHEHVASLRLGVLLVNPLEDFQVRFRVEFYRFRDDGCLMLSSRVNFFYFYF